jgi:signal transduction histidine kinase/integral membrane sensor domain MASE1/ActR/RegA family two-component response regulator
MRRTPFPYPVLVLALAAAYFAAAKAGLRLAFVAEQVTVVWPPTGIALAALLVFGYRLWPGVALGAFLANITLHQSAAAAAGIVAGNTLEALCGAWLLRRVGFDGALGRLRDALGLVGLAAVVSTTVSATIGVTSLCLDDPRKWPAFGSLWFVWWLGDATGDLLVAPALLAWADGPRRPRPPARLAEAAALMLALVAVSLVVFAGRLTPLAADHPLEYAIFPFAVWAALRFGQRGSTAVTLVASAVAVWGTVNGFGPFSRGTAHENLILLQCFMAVVAVTGLVLAAAITERDHAERRRAADQAVTHILADSATLAEASPRLLRAVGEGLGWDFGAVWEVDPEGRALVCVEVWHRPGLDVRGFEAASRTTILRPGVGLPGRVWAAGRPAWIADVVADPNFPRFAVAAREGLHGAFGFPILVGGAVRGVVEFFSREIRQPDQAVLRMFAALGSQIGQFTERKRAEEALMEADRRKDEFLAMLAHELRNPLAPVRNALHVLRSPAADADAAARARGVLERQVQHLTRLVDDLLDVSRVMRGRIELHKEPLDLGAAVARAVETVQPLMDARGHELTVELPAEPVPLEADLVRLAQVFANLLHNAAKYTEPGGDIRLSAAREDAGVVVRVRDNGVGIAADLLPHVFELFVQADRSIARSHGGLGIGLTVVRRLVEMHGGSVTAHSDGPDRGSEFVVRLPVSAATLPPPGKSGGPGGPAPARRVLVVDDNADAADSLAQLLRLAGHEVRVAYDGPAALEAARTYRPDAVLLDIGLPGMSGYEVAKLLRTQPGPRPTLLVAVTGYGRQEDRRRSREAGFDVHLTKPVDPHELERVLTTRRGPAAAAGGREGTG